MLYIYIEFEIYVIVLVLVLCCKYHTTFTIHVIISICISKTDDIMCQKSISVNIDYRFGQCTKCYVLLTTPCRTVLFLLRLQTL